MTRALRLFLLLVVLPLGLVASAGSVLVARSTESALLDARARVGGAAARMFRQDMGELAHAMARVAQPIANPDLAPYGQAARSAIEAALASDPLEAKQVFGENVGQAFSLVATGNADAGVIALSAVMQKPEWLQGAYLEVPADLHPPIRQDALLLRRGKQNEAAIRFLAFLKEDAVRETIKASGYR